MLWRQIGQKTRDPSPAQSSVECGDKFKSGSGQFDILVCRCRIDSAQANVGRVMHQIGRERQFESHCVLATLRNSVPFACGRGIIPGPQSLLIGVTKSCQNRRCCIAVGARSCPRGRKIARRVEIEQRIRRAVGKHRGMQFGESCVQCVRGISPTLSFLRQTNNRKQCEDCRRQNSTSTYTAHHAVHLDQFAAEFFLATANEAVGPWSNC